MSLFSMLLAATAFFMFIAAILYVFFGQITVRKLRKNPMTKDNLGLEFASGWDILNVAGALALPRWLNRKLRSTPLAYLYADAELLGKYTNRFDRVLAFIFYSLFMGSGLTMALLVLLEAIGVFD